MNRDKFEKELKETVPFALRHASDFYNLKKIADFKKVNRKDFLRKCHEGFNLAQNRIVANLLEIEKEHKEQNIIINSIKKGKHNKELIADKEYQELIKQKKFLEIQMASFRAIADVIAWTMLRIERASIKSFLINNGSSGYLQDKDIESSIVVAKKLNENKDNFSLITDITSCLHKGDIITVDMGKLIFTEIKQNTEINNLIEELLSKIIKEDKIDEDILKNIYKKSPKNGLKQIERFMSQTIDIGESMEYMQKDKCFDSRLNMEKLAITPRVPDVNFQELLELGLNELYKKEQKKKYLILPFDCCIAGLFKEEYGSDFVRAMDFRHNVYHFLVKPWDECGYANKKPGEFSEYYKIDIHNFLRILFLPALLPIFLIIKENYAIDLILGKISIYIYFDIDRFFEMCEERGLNPKWVKSKNDHPDLMISNGKCLEVDGRGGRMLMGNGIVYRMIYEFQSGYNIIDQLVKNKKISNKKC